MSLWKSGVNIQEKQTNNKNISMVKSYHHNASVHKIISEKWFIFISSRFFKQCVVVVVVVAVVVFLSHTHAQPTYTQSHAPAHACPLVFLVEKDMAQWRDGPPPGTTRGDGTKVGAGHGYQGSSSSPAFWGKNEREDSKRETCYSRYSNGELLTNPLLS